MFTRHGGPKNWARHRPLSAVEARALVDARLGPAAPKRPRAVPEGSAARVARAARVLERQLAKQERRVRRVAGGLGSWGLRVACSLAEPWHTLSLASWRCYCAAGRPLKAGAWCNGRR